MMKNFKTITLVLLILIVSVACEDKEDLTNQEFQTTNVNCDIDFNSLEPCGAGSKATVVKDVPCYVKGLTITASCEGRGEVTKEFEFVNEDEINGIDESNGNLSLEDIYVGQNTFTASVIPNGFPTDIVEKYGDNIETLKKRNDIIATVSDATLEQNIEWGKENLISFSKDKFNILTGAVNIIVKKNKYTLKGIITFNGSEIEFVYNKDADKGYGAFLYNTNELVKGTKYTIQIKYEKRSGEYVEIGEPKDYSINPGKCTNIYVDAEGHIIDTEDEDITIEFPDYEPEDEELFNKVIKEINLVGLDNEIEIGEFNVLKHITVNEGVDDWRNKLEIRLTKDSEAIDVINGITNITEPGEYELTVRSTDGGNIIKREIITFKEVQIKSIDFTDEFKSKLEKLEPGDLSFNPETDLIILPKEVKNPLDKIEFTLKNKEDDFHFRYLDRLQKFENLMEDEYKISVNVKGNYNIKSIYTFEVVKFSPFKEDELFFNSNKAKFKIKEGYTVEVNSFTDAWGKKSEGNYNEMFINGTYYISYQPRYKQWGIDKTANSYIIVNITYYKTTSPEDKITDEFKISIKAA